MKFLDAQQKNKEHPTTFQVPSKLQLDGLEPGTHVKICENSERFWVQLTEVDGDKMVGRVDNDLVMAHSFKCDDIITFEKKNVMGII